MPTAVGLKYFQMVESGLVNDENKDALKAIQAYCYDCMGFYVDGFLDCRTPRCPLYSFMPYRENAEHPPSYPESVARCRACDGCERSGKQSAH